MTPQDAEVARRGRLPRSKDEALQLARRAWAWSGPAVDAARRTLGRAVNAGRDALNQARTADRARRARLVREAMTPVPVSVAATTTLVEVADLMRQRDVGAVLVERGGGLVGIVTDRDLVVRGIAGRLDPATTAVDQVASFDVHAVAPDEDLGTATRLMREHAVRRIPVVDRGRPVGILSLGDLAIERDPSSALADISSAAPNA